MGLSSNIADNFLVCFGMYLVEYNQERVLALLESGEACTNRRDGAVQLVRAAARSSHRLRLIGETGAQTWP